MSFDTLWLMACVILLTGCARFSVRYMRTRERKPQGRGTE